MKPLYQLLYYIKGYQSQIVLGILYSFLNLLFDALPEVILGFAVDTVVNQNNSFLAAIGFTTPLYQLLFLGVVIILGYTLESIFEYLSEIKWKELAQLLQHNLRLDAYNHVQRLDIDFFEKEATGTLLSILVDDINLLEHFFNKGFNDILQLFFGSIIIGSIFLYISPFLTLFCVLPIPLILFISFHFKNKLNKLYTIVREKSGKISALLATNILGITMIKSYTTEAFEADRLQQRSSDYMQANWQTIKTSTLFIPIVRMAIVIGQTSTIVLGGILVLKGALPIGAYSMLIFLIQRLLWPFYQLGHLADQYERASACAQRVLHLVSIPKKIKEGKKQLIFSNVQGNICFDNVSFSYPNGHTVFTSLSFDIQAGQTVGFVGPTGSGKTTIVKLLLRFFDPTSGTISLDQNPIQEYSLASLRQAIGLVSQDVFLVDGTIKENVSYGSANTTDQAINRALAIAQADEFIKNLAKGVEAQVGERGQRISGGQKQRISIARAIVKDPRIFIFDEATSAVDNETEEAIQHALGKIAKDHTTIIIAHRLSTIRHADVIFVLDKGAIIQQGTHQELIDAEGMYQHLWKLQTGDIEPVKKS